MIQCKAPNKQNQLIFPQWLVVTRKMNCLLRVLVTQKEVVYANIVGKEEDAGHEASLFFLLCFLKVFFMIF